MVAMDCERTREELDQLDEQRYFSPHQLKIERKNYIASSRWNPAATPFTKLVLIPFYSENVNQTA